MSDAIESIKNLGVKKIAILAIAGFTVLVGMVILALTVSTGSLAPLYSNLSLEDSQKIVTELESRSVNYELVANGTQVMVPSDKVLRLRMAFAEMGVPKSAGAMMGYEIFDKDEQLGTSSFVQNMNQLRALEGELARTVSSMQQVQAARIHLVIPKRELFKKDRNEPTASIHLTLSNSERLTTGEIAAVRYLVSTAVPGLSVENITVVDSRGILLARGGGEEGSVGAFASNAEEFKSGYEKKMRMKVEDLLEKYVGLGNVKAQISADIDFDRTVTNSEVYDPEGQVASSVQTTEETESATDSAGGTVSVANNLPEGAGEGGGSNRENRSKIDEVTNFLNSKTIKNHVSETGKVNKLSVAVLIDGIYTEDIETGEFSYKDRTPEELEKMTNLVKSAIGFDVERGDIIEVTNLPFSPDFGGYKAEGMFDWVKQDLQSIVQILVMGLVAMMVVLMVVRPLVKRALELNTIPAGQLEADPATPLLTGPGGVVPIAAGEGGAAAEDDEGFGALMGMHTKSKPSSIAKLNEVVEQGPEEALAALRTWMYGDAGGA